MSSFSATRTGGTSKSATNSQSSYSSSSRSSTKAFNTNAFSKKLVANVEEHKDFIFVRKENGEKKGPFHWDRIFDDYLKNKINADIYIMDSHHAIKWKQLKDAPELHRKLKAAKEALQKEMVAMKNRKKVKRKKRVFGKRKNESSATSVSGSSSSYSSSRSSWSGSTYAKKRKNPKYAGKDAQELIRMCTDKDTALLDALEKVIGVERLSQIESQKHYEFMHSPKNIHPYNLDPNDSSSSSQSDVDNNTVPVAIV